MNFFSEAMKRNCYFSDNYKAIKEHFIEIINEEEDIGNSSSFNEAMISFSLSPKSIGGYFNFIIQLCSY